MMAESGKAWSFLDGDGHTLNDNGFTTALELEVKISDLEMEE